MTSLWCNRPYQPGDEHGILALRGDTFGDRDPVRTKMSTWRWQFKDNPAGRPFIRLVEAESRIVAQYAVIPMRLLVEGVQCVTAFSCDTMTHPAFQRRGLFSLLAGAVYRDMEEEAGIRGVYGFPNRVSMPGFTGKLGWSLIAGLPVWAAPARPWGLSGLFPLEFTAEGKALHLSPLSSFGPAFDGLWESRRPEKGVTAVRDARFLSWRYTACPDFGYRAFCVGEPNDPAGYLVLRPMTIKGIPFLILVDLFPLSLASPSLVRLLGRMAAHERAVAVLSLFPPAFRARARKIGFYPVPRRFSPKTFNLAGRFSSACPPALRQAAAWSVTFGDTDIV